MHRILTIALCCLALAAPIAAAQWTDPKNDHEVGYTAANQADESTYVWTKGEQTGWYPMADLVGASVEEQTDDTVSFVIKVANKKHAGNEPHPVQIVRYAFEFTYHGQARGMQLAYYPQNDRAIGAFGTYDKGRFRADEYAQPTELTDGPGWRVTFAKERLRDQHLVPARAGDVFEKVVVKSQTFLFSYYNPCSARTPPVECWKARDVIGTGVALGDYVLQRSPAGVGHLALTSPAPYRSSNGLATTYMFELEVHNLGDEPDAAFVGLDKIPPDWKISWPSYVELSPKTATKFPIAVTVPFTHLHGKETYVNVTATSERAPGTHGRLAIGVVWTKIPQPAGHHAELYVHGDGGWDVWMNTLKDDPDAKADALIRPTMYAYYGTSKEYGYEIRLNPPLRSGLDFDLGRQLHLEVAGKFREDAKSNMTAQLFVLKEDRSHVLIAQGSSPPVAIGANQEHTFQLDLPIAPTGDRIPYSEDSHLVLRIEFAYETKDDPLGALGGSDDPYPQLLPGRTFLALPLVEFVDHVDDALLSSLTRYTLAAKTETFKLVNPGKTTAFAIDVTNTGRSGDELSWKVVGSNTEWADVYPHDVSLPAGDNATILVTVEPPELATEGEAAELLLLGQSKSEPNAQVFVRLVAQVITSQEIESEAELADRLRGIAAQNKAGGVPGLGLGAALVGIGLALARRRR